MDSLIVKINEFGRTNQGILNIIAIVIPVIVGIIGYFKGWWKHLWNKFLIYYRTKIQNNYKKRFESKIKEKPKVISPALYKICEYMIIHLFDEEHGEEITLDEYGMLLEESIKLNKEKLQKCIWIALTRPSDWFMRNDIGGRIREYFKFQLEVKKKFDNIEMQRYIILPEKDYKKDTKKDLLSEQHKDKIKLKFCLEEKIPSAFKNCVKDTALFELKEKDKNFGFRWAIIGDSFDVNTITKSVRDPLYSLRAHISANQDVLTHRFEDFIETLERISEEPL